MDPDTTIVSVDGISACDLISRESMMTGLFRMEGGGSTPLRADVLRIAFRILWEDMKGMSMQSRRRRRARRRNDASVVLFGTTGSFASSATATHCRRATLAYLDDICVVTRQERVGEVYRILEEALRVFSCIRVHNGKTKIWKSPVCVQRRVTGWSELHKWRTPEQPFGREGRCPRTNKASRSWALHWVTTILWPTTWGKSQASNKDFWTRSVGERLAERLAALVALCSSKSQLPTQISETYSCRRIRPDTR